MSNFVNDLKSFTYTDYCGPKKVLLRKVCCVCDRIARSTDTGRWISITTFAKYCKICSLGKESVSGIYEDDLVAEYTVPTQDSRLTPFVLSWSSCIKDDKILGCNQCSSYMENESKMFDKYRHLRHPPKLAIISQWLHVGQNT